MLPLAGVIDSRTAVAVAWDRVPALACRTADLMPLEQPPTSRPIIVQIASVPTPRRRRRDVREDVASGTACGRNLQPPVSSLDSLRQAFPLL
jgi:hypothetical protein